MCKMHNRNVSGDVVFLREECITARRDLGHAHTTAFYCQKSGDQNGGMTILAGNGRKQCRT